jgi:hypothetical protein
VRFINGRNAMHNHDDIPETGPDSEPDLDTDADDDLDTDAGTDDDLDTDTDDDLDTDGDDESDTETHHETGTRGIILRLSDLVIDRLKSEGHLTPPPAPRPPAPPPPLLRTEDADAVLLEQLSRCNRAVANCFEFSDNTDISVGTLMESVHLATTLIRMSMDLVAAVKNADDATQTHRMIYEHRAASGDIPPSPPPEMSKTIHGGRKARKRNIE